MKTHLYALLALGAVGAVRAGGGFVATGQSSESGVSSSSFGDGITETDDDLDKWLSSVQAQPLDALKACPISCREAGDDPWFLFPDADQLASCKETMLLNVVVQMAEVKDMPTIIRACTADYDTSRSMRVAFVPDETKASLCTTANKVLEDTSISIHRPAKNGEFSPSHLLSAGRQVKSYLASQKPSCSNNAMAFGYSQTSVIGIFAGAEVHQHGVTADVLQQFLDHVESESVSGTTVVQLCGAKDRGADYSIGIVASSVKNLDFVQDVVKTWADGKCVSESQVGAGEDWMPVTLRVPVPLEELSNHMNGTISNSTANYRRSAPGDISARFARLSPRADCTVTTVQAGEGCVAVAQRCGISQTKLQNYNRADLCNSLVLNERVCCSTGTLPSTLPAGNSDGTCKTRQVVLGDDCASLANKCGITGDDFTKANPQSGLCSKLSEGQHVCCSQGDLPDLRPKKGADGYCAVYRTKKDDNCAKIAASNMLSLTQVENFNKNTWGWNGCKLLYPDFNMCVSDGAAPMPAIVPNAVCGPTMNGTVQPPAGTNISMLNPCPLNVCCNIWGQCGMTDDFCVPSQSETGAPGTAAPGKYGCISNCGRDIIKGSAPAEHFKLGYFEGWNFGRKCLHMDASQIDTSAYTHIHFAFPNVTAGDFRIEITDPLVKKQFERFKKLQGVKKVLSLGGWDFSALPGTFMILREAAQPANRDLFKRNIISFLNEHNLDGIDLDWEYPGAPDIPDIPADDPVSGLNYYRLLASIKAELGSSKTVSFAAPASFWYLRAFPIKQMAQALDYIVYMSYDLHGQWDAGNKWTSPGCPTGNCLRSHVNETETRDALSMITKAGAPSNKVLVGVSSYGRSFKMAQAGCDGEDCFFTGDNGNSNAAKGRCTDTSGYISNAEINQIIAQGRVNKRYTKEGSNIMVYDNTEWVAWMDDAMKATRTEFYHSYNFLGTTDWAIDLQDWYGDASLDEDDVEVVYLGTEVYSERTATCTPPCRFVLPPSSLPAPTVISIPPFTTSLEVGRSQGASFVVETTTITIYAPNITTDQMPMSNVNISVANPTDGGGSTGGIPPFYAIPSIDIPPIPVVVTPPGGAPPTSRWITLPPWPAVTDGPALPDDDDDPSGVDIPDDSDLPSDEQNPIIDRPPPGTGPAMVWDCPPGGVLEIDEFHAILTLDNCQGQVTLGGCAPTRTTAMDAPPESTLLIGCTLFTGTQAPDIKPFPTGSDNIIQPISTPVPDPPREDDPEDSDSDDDDEPAGVYLSCKAWFFSICIDWPELKVFGWVFPPLPPGPYRSGPPNIDWPKLPGITVKGTLPKWPAITIPAKGPIPTPDKPSNCKTQTAELCKMTTSYAGVVEGGTTRTTSSTIKETCATVYGCEVEDDTSSTETFEGCTATPIEKREEVVATPTPQVQGEAVGTSTLEERSRPFLQARAKKKSPCQIGDVVIIPEDPEDVQAIRTWLGDVNNNPNKQPWSYTEIKSDRATFTAFFYVVQLDRASLDTLSAAKGTYGIDDVYYLSEMNADAKAKTALADAQKPRPLTDIWQGKFPAARHISRDQSPRRSLGNFSTETPDVVHRDLNETMSGEVLRKRNDYEEHVSDYWELSQLSAPPAYAKFQSWKKSGTPAREQDPKKPDRYFNTYWYPKGTGPTQYVYNIESDLDLGHSEFQGLGGRLIRLDYTSPYGGDMKTPKPVSESDLKHGTAVSSKILGSLLGSGREVTMVLPVNPGNGFAYTSSSGKARSIYSPEAAVLETFIRVMDDILDPGNNKQGRAIINYSGGLFTDGASEARVRMLWKIIKKLSQYNVLVVAAVHNSYKERGDNIDAYPAGWGDVSRADYLSNVLSVGAVQQSQRVATFTPYQQWVTYAPGQKTYIAVPGEGIVVDDGSSMSAPLVAGMAASLRSLPSKWQEDLKDPKRLKALVKILSRPLPMGKLDKNPAKPKIPAGKIDTLVSTAWNGQVFSLGHCLLDTTEAKGQGQGNAQLDKICPTIEDIKKADADKLFSPIGGGTSGEGGSGGGGSGGGGSSGIPIEHKPGPAGPLCNRPQGLGKRGGQCGTVCTGYYCSPTPVGPPPDYYDPEDPAHKVTAGPSLPSLTPEPDLGDCPKTTTQSCNAGVGGGHAPVCVDVTICATPTPTPDPIPTPEPFEPPVVVEPPKPATCRLHVAQFHWFATLSAAKNPMFMEVTSYINEVQQSYDSANTDFGYVMTWYKGSSKFPTDVSIDIRREKGAVDLKKRGDIPPPGETIAKKKLLMSYDLYFTAGDQHWSSGNTDESRKPFCRVGAWDADSWNGINQLEPSRQMDCYWTC